MMRTLLIVVVWYFTIQAAVTYGSIWHSQNNPTPNVVVQLKSGNTETGALRRAWDRQWILSKSDGSEIRFSDESFSVMAFQPPTDQTRGFWWMWRSWVPVMLVSSACLLALLWPGLSRFLKRAAELKKPPYSAPL